MQETYIALGSNLGNRFEALQRALALIAQSLDTVVSVSPIYASQAVVQFDDQPAYPFLNAVARISISEAWSPQAVLEQLLRIEGGMGRIRSRAWDPRCIDLDLLAMGSLVVRDEHLMLPHPRLDQRRWVLRPWFDISPTFFVPAPYSSTVADLYKNCVDHAPMHVVSLPACISPSQD